MKKCASCTKDLPEAALHCVFCGAKQPPAPAVQPGLAKTAFGYSNEMMEQLKGQAPPSSGLASPGPYQPPPQTPQYSSPPQQPQRSNSPSQQPMAPASHANAATVFVQGGPPAQPQQQWQPPPQQPSPAAFLQTAVSPPQQPQQQWQQPQQQYNPVPVQQPQHQQPMMGVNNPGNYNAGPIPAAGGQYQAARMTGGRPVEPWKDALPLVMIVWGIATLVAFATPLHISPMAFNWDIIIHGEGKQKIPMLVTAAIGLLGVVLGAIPMVAMPRGILATLLGLSAFVVPIALVGDLPPWQVMVPMLGLLLLIPGQLIRAAYVDALLPRVLVTIGVFAVLSPTIVPDHGVIPLVELFKGVINGHVHGAEIVVLAGIVFAVLNLLVWLPGPASAGGKVFAWIWILSPLIIFGVTLADAPSMIVEGLKTAPGVFVAWVPVSTCAAFIGYGLATVFGKQLE